MLRILMATIIWICSSCSFGNKATHPGPNNYNLSRTDKIKSILSDPVDQRALIIAHRGDWRNAPENSLLAIQNCINIGIDVVEIDIRKTKDGALVLMHDDTLGRVTNGRGKISGWTLDSLEALNLKNGIGFLTDEKIPTFQEALELAKDRILIQPDYKCKDCFEDIKNLITQTQTEDQVVFGAKNSIAENAEFFGDLYGKAILVRGISEETEDVQGLLNEFSSDLPQAFVFKFRNDTANHLSFIPSIHKETRIWVQTIQSHRCGGHHDDLAIVDPEAAYGWLLNEGVSIFLTDRPVFLLDYLRSKGLHN